MFHRVVTVISSHHTWQDIKTNQLHELYIAMMMKTLGLSLIGIFVPVYLYQLGYSVPDISLFYVMVYGLRIGLDLLAVRFVGYFGPKHMMILSHIFLVIALMQLLTLASLAWPLALLALAHAIASGLFFTAYHIEFSKIQSSKRAGNEIGKMYMVAKFAGAIGPLLGGAVATIFSLQWTIVLAMVIIISSALPLALSPEPVRKYQHVSWKNFPWPKVKWDLLSNFGLSFDQMAFMLVWPLYVSLFIFTDNVYLNVGLITSIGLVGSIISAQFFGKIIDKGFSNRLLSIGVVGSSIGHVLRSIIRTIPQTYAFNLVSDSVSIAVRMPYTKGLYAAASSYEGYRNAYIGTIMVSSNVMRCLTFVLLYVLSSTWSTQGAMQLIFLTSAVFVWATLLHKFKALKS